MHHNAVRENQVMATGNIHKNLVKFGSAVFELCEETDTHTNTQKDLLIIILHNPTG